MNRSALLAALLIGTSAIAPAIATADDATTIVAGGSTALLPLVKAASEAYHDANPDISVSAQGGGSGTGLAQVAAGAFQIGDSDIPADPKKYPDLVDHKVCVVGFAIIANPAVGVKNLTKDQAIKVFSGAVTNWKEVGGADQKIVIVNRPRTSGTRAVFTKYLMGSTPLTETGLTEDATGQVVNIVQTTAGAVSYAALSGTRGKPVQEVSIDGTAPTDENIQNGSYPIWSFEHMYTKGQPDRNISRFLAFVQSNSTLIHSQMFVLARDMHVKAGTDTNR